MMSTTKKPILAIVRDDLNENNNITINEQI